MQLTVNSFTNIFLRVEGACFSILLCIAPVFVYVTCLLSASLVSCFDFFNYPRLEFSEIRETVSGPLFMSLPPSVRQDTGMYRPAKFATSNAGNFSMSAISPDFPLFLDVPVELCGSDRSYMVPLTVKLQTSIELDGTQVTHLNGTDDEYHAEIFCEFWTLALRFEKSRDQSPY